MRISNNMQTHNFLSSLNKSQERENNIQEQLSDGKAIHRPSDSPVKTVRSLRNNTNLSLNGQYAQNLQDAQSWMNTTDGSMSSLSAIMIKANELVVSADDTKTPDELNIVGKQVNELINEIVSIGNTKVGDRYVFAGQNDSTQPFTRTRVKDPNSSKTQEIIVYNGDSNKISMPIQQGAANPNQDSINLTGTDVFGPITPVYGQQTLSSLNHLLEIKNELQKTASISQTNDAGGIGTVGGTYTGAGFTSFDVRINAIDNGPVLPAATGLAAGTATAVTPTTPAPVPGTGHVTGASYSTDGGNTWIPVPTAQIDGVSTPSASIITLPSGITFTITDSAKNTPYYTNATSIPPVINQDGNGNSHADVYSFRVPQAPGVIQQSNPKGGAATVIGTFTGSNTPYSVRITGTNAAGQITGAKYSTDGGISWDGLSTVSIGSPSTLSLSKGVNLTVAASPRNTVEDSYSFQVPQGHGPDVKWLSGVATNYVKNDHNLQLQAHTQLGSRMSMYEMAANMLQDQKLTIETDLSENEDIDMAKALTDFNTSKNVYQSSLSVGAKIMPKTLVDFL